MLLDEELDVLFITETDTKIENEKDFKVAGYKTIFHIREENTQKVRMMCFIICVIALCMNFIHPIACDMLQHGAKKFGGGWF